MTRSEIPVIKVSILQIPSFIVNIRAINEISEQFLSFIIIDDYNYTAVMVTTGTHADLNTGENV